MYITPVYIHIVPLLSFYFYIETLYIDIFYHLLHIHTLTRYENATVII